MCYGTLISEKNHATGKEAFMPDIQREDLHYDLLVKKVRILDPEFRILNDMDIAIRD